MTKDKKTGVVKVDKASPASSGIDLRDLVKMVACAVERYQLSTVDLYRAIGKSVSLVQDNPGKYGGVTVEEFCRQVNDASGTDLKAASVYQAARVYRAIGDKGFAAAIKAGLSWRNLRHIGTSSLPDEERHRILVGACEGKFPQTEIEDRVRLEAESSAKVRPAEPRGRKSKAYVAPDVADEPAGDDDNDEDDSGDTGYSNPPEERHPSEVAFCRNFASAVARAAAHIKKFPEMVKTVCDGISSEDIKLLFLYIEDVGMAAAIDDIKAALDGVEPACKKIRRIHKTL